MLVIENFRSAVTWYGDVSLGTKPNEMEEKFEKLSFCNQILEYDTNY